MHLEIEALDKFGNAVVEGKTAELVVEIVGPARFAGPHTGLTKIPKLALTDGAATLDVVWHEHERPRPCDEQGHAPLTVQLRNASKVRAGKRWLARRTVVVPRVGCNLSPALSGVDALRTILAS